MNPDANANAQVNVRRCASVADYHACQRAQREAWGIREEGYVVPVATLIGADLHGGLVLGAFLPSGEAVGLSFAFLGRIEGELGLYSQLTGIVPGYQGQRIGERMKQFQRDWARKEGLGVIAWAYDPLQMGNAKFNLGKLGATARRYLVDMYGPRTDDLNLGTPTDRLVVEWSTTEDRAGLALPPEKVLALPGPDQGFGLKAPLVALEIPGDIARLRAESPSEAQARTEAARRAFLDGFALGYRAEGFVALESGGTRRGFYLLRRAGAGH